MEKRFYSFIDDKVKELLNDKEIEISREMNLNLEPIGLSSYDIVQLFIAIEDEFKIQIPDDFLFISKIDDVVSLLVDLHKKKCNYVSQLEDIEKKLFE